MRTAEQQFMKVLAGAIIHAGRIAAMPTGYLPDVETSVKAAEAIITEVEKADDPAMVVPPAEVGR